MNPIIPSSKNTQNFTLPFIAMNKSVKPFDGLDRKYSPDEYSHQIDAQMISTLGKQPPNLVAHNQRRIFNLLYLDSL